MDLSPGVVGRVSKTLNPTRTRIRRAAHDEYGALGDTTVLSPRTKYAGGIRKYLYFRNADMYAVWFVMTWVIAFLIGYIYAIYEYGFLLGAGLGWFPAGVVATVVAAL